MKLSSRFTLTSLSYVAAQISSGLISTIDQVFGTIGSRNVRYDNGTYGPPVEEFHYYYDQWPIGTYAYTLGEIVNITTEAAYPSQQLNTSAGGLYSQVNGINFGSNDPAAFISVLDTARHTINEPQAPRIPYAFPDGPKLVSINLSKNSIARTYTLHPTVHYPDSYMNDLRFDMRPYFTASGGGIAYIVESSNEGMTGFITIDLGTGESWRHLKQHPSTLRANEDVPSYQGILLYLRQKGNPLSFQQEGLDGAELSLYGDIMYYFHLTSNYLYSIETQYLRANPNHDTLSAKRTFDNVKNLGQRGGNANGFSSDNLGNVYVLMLTQNAIYIYNPATLQASPYIRDPRIIWCDSSNVGFDGYIYFNINQLPYQPDWNDGVDYRQYPGLILRSKLPDGANKNLILGPPGLSGTNGTAK